MKKSSLAIIPLLVAITACVGPKYKTNGDFTIGKTIAVEVEPHYQLFRSIGVKITKPYYKDCLVESEEIITEKVIQAYRLGIEQAFQEVGVEVVDADTGFPDSTASVRIQILGNGDYGSLRLYSGIEGENVEGHQIKQKLTSEFGIFKAMQNMPRGLGRFGRNDYCTDLWAQGADSISGDLNNFMSELAEHHVNQFKRRGALPRS